MARYSRHHHWLCATIFQVAAAALLLLSGSCNADCELESIRLLHTEDPQWIPNAIVDVGANVGCWTTRARAIFPETKILMLEAFFNFTAPLGKVKDSQMGMVDFAIEVLSREDGTQVQFWAEGATGNSIFPQLLGRGGRGHSDITPVTRMTKRLDTARKSSFLGNERIDILKLDVQGAELSVLQGATELLKEVSFVQFEGSVIEYNKGGSCYYEVDDFLRNHGFHLYDIGDIQRNKGLFRTPGVGQFDSLYIRPTSEHLPASFRTLKPNFCGNDHIPSSYNNVTVDSLGDAPTPCYSESVPQNRWFGIIGSLVAGILIGRILVPRRRDARQIGKY